MLVWTVTKMPFSEIAIKTQNSKTRWEIISFGPLVNILALKFSSVGRPVSVYMMQCQELFVPLSTTSALRNSENSFHVVGKNFCLQSLRISSTSSPMAFLVVTNPHLIFGQLGGPISTIPRLVVAPVVLASSQGIFKGHQ